MKPRSGALPVLTASPSAARSKDSRRKMHRTQLLAALMVNVALATASIAQSSDPQLARGRQGIEARTGCFLVDYSFVETEALKPGYTKDNRVFDATRDKSVKEWIFAEDISPTRIRLQHVMMISDLSGKLVEDSLLKHSGEDWEYNAPFLYDYAGSHTWKVKSLNDTPGLWTRRVTNLDDGLRYQCAAQWKMDTAYPEWSCESPAPLPLREIRDMQRKDYNVLDRTSRVIVYDNSWLEREANTKVIDENGTKTPLAKEVGKNWYVRLPDSECSAAQEFVKPRLAFWNIVRETWDRVLNGDSAFEEIPPVKGQPTRYEKIMDLEDEYMKKNLSDPVVANEARAAVLNVIQSYRKQ